MAKNDVTKAKEAQLPAEFMDALADAGQQHKDALGKDDMSVPFIQILQKKKSNSSGFMPPTVTTSGLLG